MKNKIPSNTRTSQFFAYLQVHNKDIIQLGDLQADFQISPRQEKELLEYLARKNSIIRLKRGVYVSPLSIPAGGKWQPDTKYLISCLMEVMGATYYISGQYAFHYHGLTEQIANVVTVYNNKLSGKRKLGKISVQFIKKPNSAFGEHIAIHTIHNRLAYISTLTRCVVDAIVDYKRYNTLPKAYHWIKAKINDENFLNHLITDTVLYGNISAKRRIGYIIHSLTNNKKLVKPIFKKLKPHNSWIPLDPQEKSKGKTDKAWRIIHNVQ